MDKPFSFYKLIASLICFYILFALFQNYMVDPGAETFLSHKSGQTRELKLQPWLTVMYVHVGFACVAMTTGLVNFAARSYERHRRFHRINGYVYESSVYTIALYGAIAVLLVVPEVFIRAGLRRP